MEILSMGIDPKGYYSFQADERRKRHKELKASFDEL